MKFVNFNSFFKNSLIYIKIIKIVWIVVDKFS